MKVAFRFGTIPVLVILSICLAPRNGGALTNDIGLRLTDFRFTGPGAEALALGGAFVAGVDDLTAVEWNPSALSFKKDASEKKFRFFLSGKYESLHRKETVQEELGRSTKRENLSITSTKPSFGAFGYTFEFVDIAFYWTNAYSEEWSWAAILSPSPSDNIPFRSMSFSSDIILEHYGFSFAIPFGDFLSMGASIRASHLDFQYEENWKDFEGFPTYRSSYNDSMWFPSGKIGMTFKPKEIPLAFGGSFEWYPEISLGIENSQIEPENTKDVTLQIPWKAAFGFSFGVEDGKWRIHYFFETRFAATSSLEESALDVTGNPKSLQRKDSFSIHNGVAFEWDITSQYSLVPRIGASWENNTANEGKIPDLRSFYPEEKGRFSYSLGMGLGAPLPRNWGLMNVDLGAKAYQDTYVMALSTSFAF